MKCKHCGADNSNESKFCFQCGQELSSDDVQQPEDPPVDPTHPICKIAVRVTRRMQNSVISVDKSYLPRPKILSRSQTTI